MITTINEFKKIYESKINLHVFIKVTELDSNEITFYGPYMVEDYLDKRESMETLYERVAQYQTHVNKLQLTPQKFEIVDEMNVPKNAKIVSLEVNHKPNELVYKMSSRDHLWNCLLFIADRKKICKNLDFLYNAIEALLDVNIIKQKTDFNHVASNGRGNPYCDSFWMTFDTKIDEMTLATKLDNFKLKLPSGDIIYLHHEMPHLSKHSSLFQKMGFNDVSMNVDERDTYVINYALNNGRTRIKGFRTVK